MAKMPVNRWIATREGQQVIGDIVATVVEALAEKLAGRDPEEVFSSADDVAKEWTLLLADFFGGLGTSLGQSSNIDPDQVLTDELDKIYHARLADLYDGIDAEIRFGLRQQAWILGNMTGNLVRMHRGEIGDYPKDKLDKLAKQDVYHLGWARDVIGFWAYGKASLDFGMPKPGSPGHRLSPYGGPGGGVEFDPGCPLC